MAGGFYQLWFAVRYVHVAAGAVLIGGAVAVCAICATVPPAGESLTLPVAATYEWTFWSAAAVSVATGISNLGLKGDGLLPSDTGWGGALTLKLAAALVLLAVSALRTDLVVRRAPTRALAAVYAATTGALLLILWLGLGLAHGRY